MTRLLNFFRHNAPQKILALIVAFSMWIHVMTDQDPDIEGSYTVPLTISNTPYDFVALCDEKNIQVKARAPRSHFVKYDANAFRVYVNLEGFGEGAHQVKPQIIMPQGFELIDTHPNVIAVKLDPLIEMQMPIDIVTVGALGADASIKEIRKSMDVVTVVGAKSFVEQTDRIYGTLNFSGNTSSFEVQVPMNAVDANNNVIRRVHVVPSVITVSVDLLSGTKKRIVPVIPELTVADGWELAKVFVEPAQVEISGDEEIVNSIVTLKTVPFTVQTGQRIFHSKLKLVVPEGVQATANEVTVSAEVVRKPVMRE